jgi:uncharacterized protein (TIGR02391 family)
LALSFSNPVTLVKKPGEPNEFRLRVECRVLGVDKGLFPANVPVFEGDEVELQDVRGDTRRLRVARVRLGRLRDIEHLEVDWNDADQLRQAPHRSALLDQLHPVIREASGRLYSEGQFAQAVFQAFNAIEVRVRELADFDFAGHELMLEACFGNDAPGQATAVPRADDPDERRGPRFLFRGAMVGLRHADGQSLLTQVEAQPALEYLAFASLLMRHLDHAHLHDAVQQASSDSDDARPRTRAR